VLKIQVMAFWVEKTCSVVVGYQRVRGPLGGSMAFRNFGIISFITRCQSPEDHDMTLTGFTSEVI
jgi:hypothetical protein